MCKLVFCDVVVDHFERDEISVNDVSFHAVLLPVEEKETVKLLAKSCCQMDLNKELTPSQVLS